MRFQIGFLVLILFLAGFIVSGCNKGAEEQTTVPGTADKQEPATSINNDAEITASVKAKFMTDENVAARSINVNTEDGVVTLRGTVATPLEVERAIELAKTADGVRFVHSYLKTDTSDAVSDLGEETQETVNKAENAIETGIEEVQDVGSDAAITAQIKWKLAKDKLVQAADISVDTQDRRVTLTGTVSSKEEAQRAVQIANSIQDVLKVDSNLRIR